MKEEKTAPKPIPELPKGIPLEKLTKDQRMIRLLYLMGEGFLQGLENELLFEQLSRIPCPDNVEGDKLPKPPKS